MGPAVPGAGDSILRPPVSGFLCGLSRHYSLVCLLGSFVFSLGGGPGSDCRRVLPSTFLFGSRGLGLAVGFSFPVRSGVLLRGVCAGSCGGFIVSCLHLSRCLHLHRESVLRSLRGLWMGRNCCLWLEFTAMLAPSLPPPRGFLVMRVSLRPRGWVGGWFATGLRLLRGERCSCVAQHVPGRSIFPGFSPHFPPRRPVVSPREVPVPARGCPCLSGGS